MRKHLKKNNSETQRAFSQFQDQVDKLLRIQNLSTMKNFQIKSKGAHLQVRATGVF